MEIRLSVLRKKIRRAIRESKKKTPTAAALKEQQDISSLTIGLGAKSPLGAFLNTLFRPAKIANANRKRKGRYPLLSELSEEQQLKGMAIAMYPHLKNGVKYDAAIPYVVRQGTPKDPNDYTNPEEIKKDKAYKEKYLRDNKDNIRKELKQAQKLYDRLNNPTPEDLRDMRGPQLHRPRGGYNL